MEPLKREESLYILIKAKSNKSYYLAKNGYIHRKQHNGKWIAEHRYQMQKKLGRKLKPYESVHHINGIRHDNRWDNLELWLFGIRYGQRAKDVKCPHCKKPYQDEAF